MRLSRIDLADLHAPDQIATAIHGQIGRVEGAMPVREIGRALDISEIILQPFDGFEGMLLTDRVRSQGAILANTSRGRRRARFTLAHELGHFLMERHALTAEQGFRCRASDMRETRVDQQHRRQETQANRFAVRLLAPEYKTNPFLSDDPDLRSAQVMRDKLDMSLEACLRCYIEEHPEPMAAVWSHNSQIRYSIRGPAFPWIKPAKGSRVPRDTLAARAAGKGTLGFTEIAEVDPDRWTDDERVTELFEQTRVGTNGHTVTLLWATLTEPDQDLGVEELGNPSFRK